MLLAVRAFAITDLVNKWELSIFSLWTNILVKSLFQQAPYSLISISFLSNGILHRKLLNLV